MNWSEFNKEFNKYRFSNISTWYDRYLSPPFTKIITYFAYKMRLTPNFLTILSLLIILAGMVILFWRPFSLPVKIISLGFLQIGYFIDFADGYLARMQNKRSLFGAFLDLFIDRCINFSVLIAFGFLLFINYPSYSNAFNVFLFVLSSSLYILFNIAMLIAGNIFTDYQGVMQNYGNNLKENVIKLPYQFMAMGLHFFLLSLGYIFGFLYQMVVFYGILSLGMIWALVFWLYLREGRKEEVL